MIKLCGFSNLTFFQFAVVTFKKLKNTHLKKVTMEKKEYVLIFYAQNELLV